MGKATPTDGQFLTLAASRFATAGHRTDGGVRKLYARVDLSDDRSFLSSNHRDLVDIVPGLSIHRDAAGQGWVWIGANQSCCEIHVVLERLPPSIDLILGRCALELIQAAADDGRSPGLAAVDEPGGNVIDLDAAREARAGVSG
ncbi:hypothetical protein [Aliidongia dinghuensis]|uniref:hypothetical protein n=1 Tax=Aliidongia dinghuensis TaxID=1867774 RepID=UPI001669E5BF|nr:hypothetical protein [Aliidongia dinghuensis]